MNETTVLASPQPRSPTLVPALVLHGPRGQRELERLLRSRLRVMALLAAAAAGFFALFRAQSPSQWQFFRSTPIGNGLLVFEGAVFAIAALSAVLLWRRREWTLGELRAVEYVIVALFAVYIGWSQLFAWKGSRFLIGGSAVLDGFIVRHAVDSMAVRWFGLIVGLSTLIPETWTRSALLSGGLALVAISLTIGLALTDPLYAPHLGRMVALMSFWMAVATTFATFGSYRVAELRRQILEARQLGQYKLIRPIGTGGMGEVHLAEHVMLKQPCAIKLIRPERAGDPAALRRFEREVRNTARLKHWNTVQIFDYGYADDGTFYYAMEYLPGWTLEQIVEQEGPLPPGRAIHFLRQMCAALHEAHGMGLIHRDIKPANVIACDRGGVADLVKLVDFGLVRNVELNQRDQGLTASGALLGTPAFMAPEQAIETNAIDARTDIYAVGAVAFFLLTGRAPFVKEQALQLIMAHLSEAPQPPSALRTGLGSDLDAVVLRCLEKHPAARFESATALDRALARCADAGTWSSEDAAAWWRDHAAPDPAAG